MENQEAGKGTEQEAPGLEARPEATCYSIDIYPPSLNTATKLLWRQVFPALPQPQASGTDRGANSSG